MKRIFVLTAAICLLLAALLPAALAEGEIALQTDTVTAKAGGQATVTVALSNASGMDSLQLRVNYDPEALRLTAEPEPGEPLAGGVAVSNIDEAGVIVFAFASAAGVREDGTVLVDGGRQAEHTYRVTVSAVSDRERDGNTALLSSLTPILLRGVPMGERTLHPLELKTEGETLTFTVELCVPLPRPEKPGMEPPGRMATLNLDI